MRDGSAASTRWRRAIAVLFFPGIAACTLLGASVDKYAIGSDGACPAPNITCEGQCIDTRANARNCGACGLACAPAEICTDGRCQQGCAAGQTTCADGCANLGNDPRHCGTCETSCKPGEVCGDGHCAGGCPDDETSCSGSCVDVQTDVQNCGTCGTVCGANDDCFEGKCVVGCRTLLDRPIKDPWGTSWDGAERAPSGWSQASANCATFRGRLPTATELNRVAQNRSASVQNADGNPNLANYLWSIAAVGPATHARLRLSDADSMSQADTSLNPYRCVCPPPPPKKFVGTNCSGTPGAPCVGLNDENKRHNIDGADRGALSKGGAIWECAFYKGHLATASDLAEAIQQGLPPGSGAWLHTGDDVSRTADAILRFSDGVNFAYSITGTPNSLTWATTTDPRPFRCVGENYSAGKHPAVIPNEWVGPGFRKGETVDSPLDTYIHAVDQCWSRGGHLPTANELSELVLQGLPGGTGAFLWTSDQSFRGENVQLVLFAGTQSSRVYTYPTDISSATKVGPPYAYRCVYYPVDASYAGPPSTACSGGCAQFSLPGTSGAKVWMDKFDRAPPLNVSGAIDACRKLGGHLASERDFAEAIRHPAADSIGLPNGSSIPVLTNDLEEDTVTPTNPLLVGTVKWSGTSPTFDDSSTVSSWQDPATPGPYRCVWTNEVR